MNRINRKLGLCDVVGFLAELNYTFDDLSLVYPEQQALNLSFSQPGRQFKLTIVQTVTESQEHGNVKGYLFLAEQNESEIEHDVLRNGGGFMYHENYLYRELIPASAEFDTSFKSLQSWVSDFLAKNGHPWGEIIAPMHSPH